MGQPESARYHSRVTHQTLLSNCGQSQKHLNCQAGIIFFFWFMVMVSLSTFKDQFLSRPVNHVLSYIQTWKYVHSFLIWTSMMPMVTLYSPLMRALFMWEAQQMLTWRMWSKVLTSACMRIIQQSNPWCQDGQQSLGKWPMYSEDAKQLAHDPRRYVACSLSKMWLATRLNIEHNPAVTRQPWGLKKVLCSLWKADYIEIFMTLEELGLKSLNHLMRCDKYSANTDDYILPAATKISCVSKFDGKCRKFVDSEHALYMVSPFCPKCFVTH